MNIRERIQENYPDEEFIFYDGLDDAIIGVSQQFTKSLVITYSYLKCIDVLVEKEDMTPDEAIEYLDFNTISMWVGEKTPAFLMGEDLIMDIKDQNYFAAKKLQNELDALIDSIRGCNHDIRVTWMDEYGGTQSISGGIKITVERTK